MDIRQQLLAAFDLEHREHLDAIRIALAAAGADRPVDWNDVFRRAHSLKGASRAVDLPPVEAVAHRLETLFERIVDGSADFDGTALGATHLALDRIEAFVADVKGGAAVMPEDALLALDRCLGMQAPTPPEQPAPAIALPPPAGGSIVQAGLPAPPEPASEPGQAVLRVPAAAVEAMMRASHGLARALPGEASVAAGLAQISAIAADLRQGLERARTGEGDRTSEMARGALAEIDAGVRTLARAVRDLALLQRSVAAEWEAASGRVREQAERLALVPAETAFGGFARAIREMARSEGREVGISVRGLDLPIDRAMLQVLKDPVLHALRNALSHGFEPAERRQQAGKPPTPEIVFDVGVRGGRLVVGIHDDGPGPDLLGIEEKARQRGLLGLGEDASAERLLALVFEPGFSTAATIDTVSGRGIGLSVVADAARRLNGSVQLEPRVPYGASLTMNLPLSAAQRPVLLVEAAGSTYALPGAAVERLLQLDQSALDSVAGRPVARLRDGDAAVTLPLVDLARLVDTGSEPERQASFPAIVVRGSGGRCVLAVERLMDVRTLLVLPPPPIGGHAGLLSGTVILGNDMPVLVLDADGVIARARDASARGSAIGVKSYTGGQGTMPVERRSTILVVDDSITTRTLEKSILEAAGYRVVVCVDGQDALDRLRAGIEPVHLVVADVEMPRLDGFGLVKALRAEAAFAELPVILMTSRGASADVAKGLELGASAYLTKQKFDQRELLDTVGQLL